MSNRFYIACVLILSFLFSVPAHAQEIDFGTYSSRYTVSTMLSNGTLDFGFLAQNEGLVEIDLDFASVIEIEGVRYLDVIVDITPDGPFQISGCGTPATCSIPLTIEASYSNFGEVTETGAKNRSVFIGSSPSLLTAQFPILRRTQGPAGPPPTPVYNGYDLQALKETAYLFVYGYINVGNVDPGVYSTNITVSINYD